MRSRPRSASAPALACRSCLRGGGTSIAGNALSSGVVLDLSRHLNRVIGVDPAARTAEVEPGAVLDDITAAGAPHGLRFGPDPSTHARASIGGSIGNNACGARALRYGRTADNVVALEVITGTGVRFTARRYGRDGTPATGPEAGLLSALGEVVGERLAMVRTEFGRFPPAGFRLLARAPAARERHRRRQVPRRHGGHAGADAASHGPPRRGAPRDGDGGARLRRHGGGR